MPNFPKVAQTIPSAVFTKNHIFQNSLKSQYTFGLLLLQNVSPKNFLKSPNLVTLVAKQQGETKQNGKKCFK